METAYLGPPIDHLATLRLAMEKRGERLSYIPDYVSWTRDRPETDKPSRSKTSRRFDRIRTQLWGTHDSAYLRAALEMIDTRKIDTIWAFWGTLPLADIKALKKLRPGLTVVLHLLCHPLGLTPLRVRIQNLLLSHAMSSLDGIVVSSVVMKNYLSGRINGAAYKPMIVVPPCWSEEYAPSAIQAPLSARPNILFAGRMDWKTGQPSDNVTGLLAQLMQEGIEVHFCRSAESVIERNNAFPFDAVPLRDFAALAAPFDASLIVYNLDQVPVKDRFEVTVPDRLISSVSAGIPVALPEEGFSACYEYLSKYRAILRYRSMAHLAEQLRDRNTVRNLRAMAHEDCRAYRVERQLQRLLSFSSNPGRYVD